jgi:hypothetical protein
MSQWPKQNYASMVEFYGPVGENQTSLALPYPMVLDWDKNKKVERITCHKKIHNPLLNIFRRLLEEYGYIRIKELGIDQFGGCLNVRKMRGGSSWSIHSWGAAVDLDADRNLLRENHRTARFARPEYKAMWDIITAEGATSLGLARDFDWMHWQFADL